MLLISDATIPSLLYNIGKPKQSVSILSKKKKKKQNKIKEEKNTLVSYFHGDDGPRLTSIVAPSEPQTRGCEEGILRQLNPPPGTPEHSG